MDLNEFIGWQDVKCYFAGQDIHNSGQCTEINLEDMNSPHFHLGWELKLFPDRKLEVIPPYALHCGTTEQLAVWMLRGDKLFFAAGSTREARVIDNPEIIGVLDKILTLCSDCSELTGKSGVSHLLCVVWQLLCRTADSAECGKNRSKPAGICDIVMDYLENNYARCELSVEEIAEYTGYSSQYINRKFKENGLGSLRQFMIKMRLRHAAVLLETGKCSIGFVSQLTGWRNQFYFSNVFRKHYGISPCGFTARAAAVKGKQNRV